MLAILLLLFFLPVRLWIDYKHRGMKEDSFLVQISTLAGALSYSLELPVVRSSGKGMTFAQGKGKQKKGAKAFVFYPLEAEQQLA
ncbi:MAG: hypothetical protein ACOX21_09960 [Bacillota bacterium]